MNETHNTNHEEESAQIVLESAQTLLDTSEPAAQFSNTAVVMIEKDNPPQENGPSEEVGIMPSPSPPPPPPPPPLSQPSPARNSFNNLIKLDIRPIEMTQNASQTSSSPLPPPPPSSTNLVRANVYNVVNTTRRPLVDELSPSDNNSRCQLRRNSSFPNKTAFSRRGSCVGGAAAAAAAAVVVSNGGVQKVAMNGSLQYHDVKTKIQQFEKIRAEAAAAAAASTTNVAMSTAMSSSSVILIVYSYLSFIFFII